MFLLSFLEVFCLCYFDNIFYVDVYLIFMFGFDLHIHAQQVTIGVGFLFFCTPAINMGFMLAVPTGTYLRFKKNEAQINKVITANTRCWHHSAKLCCNCSIIFCHC